MISHVSELFLVLSTKWSMGSSLDELLNAEFKEAFDEFDKVTNLCLISNIVKGYLNLLNKRAPDVDISNEYETSGLSTLD